MKDPAWKPDEGPSSFNAKSGATVTGVRFPLVAFNVNLQTKDLDIGKKIVKAVVMGEGVFLMTEVLLDETPEPSVMVPRMLDMLVGAQQSFYDTLREM